MEGWTVIRFFVGAMVFLGLVGVVLVVYAWGIRWLWRERGIGFAHGWYTVVDQRDIHASTRGAAPAQAPRPGERMADSAMVSSPPSTPAPEPTKRAPAGPPRYLVPTEKE
jgi:hypothetical protein